MFLIKKNVIALHVHSNIPIVFRIKKKKDELVQFLARGGKCGMCSVLFAEEEIIALNNFLSRAIISPGRKKKR